MVENAKVSADLIALLVEAVAREMKVAMQYMLQHTLYIGGDSSILKAAGFVTSHKSIFLPGKSLKKIAITEMRHAEAIAERVSNLGGEPPTQHAPLVLGKTVREILQIDRAEEELAIELYKQIIATAGKNGDHVTEKLFVKILSDEEEHLSIFEGLLETK